jgi:hypothetical protein
MIRRDSRERESQFRKEEWTHRSLRVLQHDAQPGRYRSAVFKNNATR